MSNTTKPRRVARFQPQILPDYEPVRVLWSSPNAPYPSEQSARWAIRQHRELLAAASALALHQGRLLVHPEIFARVIERSALEAASRSKVPA